MGCLGSILEEDEELSATSLCALSLEFFGIVIPVDTLYFRASAPLRYLAPSKQTTAPKVFITVYSIRQPTFPGTLMRQFSGIEILSLKNLRKKGAWNKHKF